MWYMTLAPNPPQPLSGSKWLVLPLLLIFLAACGGDNTTTDRKPATNAVQDSAFYTVQLRVSVPQASIFSQPDRNAAVVYNLVQGDVVTAVGRSDADVLGTIFYAVEIGDVPGWVTETQVDAQGDTSRLITIPLVAFDPVAVADSNAPPTPGLGVVARAYGPNAPIYASPDTTSNVIRMAGETETLEVAFVTGYTLETRYFGVRLASGFGWVDERDFLISGDISTLAPVAIGAPTPTLSVPTTTPTPTATLSASATLSSASVTTNESTPLNSNPNTAVPATPRPSNTPTSTPTAASIRAIEPPPITITLPTGWESAHITIPLSSALASDTLNLSLYEGPLATAERGYIWVLWRFDLLLDANGELSLWPNALLYLRSVLFAGCNIGVYPEQRRPYAIGNQTGTGTIFSAVGCGPDAPDVAGWLVAMPLGTENYLFYIGISPAEDVAQARTELQTILDSIRFVDA